MPYTRPKPSSGSGHNAMDGGGESKHDTNLPFSVSNMLNKLHGQPDSYDKKSVPLSISPIPSFDMSTIAGLTPPPTPPLPLTKARAQYRFGKTLGAGTYGIVREADVNGKKVAVKIILKKNVKGNEQMVYDELAMLQKLHHPHIVQFVDWFESKVCCFHVVNQLCLSNHCRTNTTLSRSWQ
jgi:calcium/calmodulin-dependent protein kinase I